MGIVGPMTSCMKVQGIYTKIQGEVQQEGNTTQYNYPGRGNFNPRVDSEEEDGKEALVKVEVRSFVTTVHNQDFWQGTVRTLVPLAVIATHSSMSLRIVLRC
jgi:hypothetical protein